MNLAMLGRAPDAVRRILEEIERTAGADRGVALYLDRGEGGLELVDSVGDPGSFPGPARPGGLRALRRRRHSPAHLLLAVPDVNGGLLHLARRSGIAFSAEDRAVATVLARQLAIHVRPLDLERHTARLERQMETIQRLGIQLGRISSLEDVALALAVESRQVTDYDGCWVYVRGDDDRELTLEAAEASAAALFTLPATVEIDTDGPGRLLAYVAARGEPLLVPDAGRDPRASALLGQSAPGVALLLQPLRYESRAVGVLVLVRGGERPFDEDDLRLLRTLAEPAGVAVENARLLGGHAQLVSEMAALLDISRSGEEAGEERALGTILARKVAGAGAADVAVLYRWEDTSTALRPVGWHGVDEAEPLDLIDHPVCRRVLRDGGVEVLRARPGGGGSSTERELAAAVARGCAVVVLAALNANGTPIGLLSLWFRDPRREVVGRAADFVQTMANHAGTALENARLVEALRQAADVDQLTGVANHRYLQERLGQEVARASRTGSPLSVLMIDLDGFKQINDHYGHAQGDRVLRGVATSLRGAVRTNDVVARYGGDEFVVLMPDTGEVDARVVAQRVVEEVESRRHQLSDGTDVGVGASVGLAALPHDGLTPARLLSAADSRMYEDKRARRAERESAAADEAMAVPQEPPLQIAVAHR